MTRREGILTIGVCFNKCVVFGSNNLAVIVPLNRNPVNIRIRQTKTYPDLLFNMREHGELLAIAFEERGFLGLFKTSHNVVAKVEFLFDVSCVVEWATDGHSAAIQWGGWEFIVAFVRRFGLLNPNISPYIFQSKQRRWYDYSVGLVCCQIIGKKCLLFVEKKTSFY